MSIPAPTSAAHAWRRPLAAALAAAALCVATLVGAPRFALAAPPDEGPGEGYVWQEPLERPDGTWVEGFWRAADEPGYAWLEAGYDADGTWVDAHWAPVEVPDEEFVYEESGVDEALILRPGVWRSRVRDGYVWVPDAPIPSEGPSGS